MGNSDHGTTYTGRGDLEVGGVDAARDQAEERLGHL
jgi:hypothetical protein